MCGIAGIIGGVDEGKLRLMTQILHHRGPDDGAIWMSRDLSAGFGHRRLSIIDLSPAARQPMATQDGRYVITYNGEIFNFRELRQVLESRGHRFISASDTEVLLKGFSEWGEGILQKLVGQFSFAIWDTVTRTLFAVRDHLGIKPFYYYLSKGTLYFASEAKSITSVCPETREVNWNGLPQYLAFLWIPGSATLFKGIRKLEPGNWLRFESGKITTGEYWTPISSSEQVLQDKSFESVRDKFRSCFSAAVKSQLVSDVPLGLLLSGGIDSTAILAEMKTSEIAPKALTAVYSERSRRGDVFDDDRDYARLAAQHFGAELLEVELAADIVSTLPRAIWHLDEPLADPTVITNMELTRVAKTSMTVLLTGMGADEILAGYPRYPATLIGERLSWAPGVAFKMMSSFCHALIHFRILSPGKLRRLLTILEHTAKDFKPRFLGFSSYFQPDAQVRLLNPDIGSLCSPQNAFDFHLDLFQEADHLSLLHQMLVTDLRTFLPCLNLENMDKTSMANSVEMRVPFLDHRLVELTLAFPDRCKLNGMVRKYILRESYANILPLDILRRKKTGYSPPVRGWIRDDLNEYAHDLLLSEQSLSRGVWRTPEVERLFRENEAGYHDNSMKIWQLLVFEQWLRIHINGTPHAPNVDPQSLVVV